MAIFPIEKFPLTIPGLLLWLDANDPSADGTQPSNGTSISSWKDKSGNGNHAFQGTMANQPIFSINILNGLPALVFDGISQIMLGNISQLPNSPDIVTYIVAQYNGVVDPGINATISGIGSVDATKQSMGLINQDSSRFNNFIWDGAENSLFPPDGDIHLFKTSFLDSSSGEFDLEINQIGSASGAGAVLLNTVYSIGGHSNVDFPFYANVNVGEIIYTSFISPDQDILLKNYLNNKWGIF